MIEYSALEDGVYWKVIYRTSPKASWRVFVEDARDEETARLLAGVMNERA